MLWKPRHTLKAAASVTIRRTLRHPPPSLLLAQYIDTDLPAQMHKAYDRRCSDRNHVFFLNV
jgi:hypothetical protein